MKLSQEKSWKSLDAASMDRMFSFASGKKTISNQEELWAEGKAVDDLSPIHCKLNTAPILPPPCKFSNFRRNPVCKSKLKSSLSIAECQFEKVDLEYANMNDPFASNDKVARIPDFSNVGAQPRQTTARSFRKVMKFTAGLENEAERRRQSCRTPGQ